MYSAATRTRHDIGKLVTYHCWTGYGFSGDPVPVTTLTPSTTTHTPTGGDGGGRRRREAVQGAASREKRSVDSLTQREMECAPWDGGSRGYWRYQYQIPARCYSKNSTIQHSTVQHSTIQHIICTGVIFLWPTDYKWRGLDSVYEIKV